jgi:hypothetical protein
MKYFQLTLILGLLYMTGCAPSRYVVPLKSGEQAITAHFGGPAIAFAGTTIPIPLTSVGYGRGIDSTKTVYANLHTTALLYGTVQADFGVCWSLYRKNRFGLSTNVSGMFTIDKWEKKFRAWPMIDVNAYRYFGTHGNFYYVGLDNWIEFSKYRAHEQLQPVHWVMNPHAGIEWCKNTWKFQLEGKWILPYRDNRPNVVEYMGIGGKGAVGIYFGVYKLF